MANTGNSMINPPVINSHTFRLILKAKFCNHLFAANQTVTSVLSTDNHKILYFFGSDRFLKIDLFKWVSLKSNFTADGTVQMVMLNTSLPTNQTMVLFKELYLLRQNSSSNEVCKFKSLTPLQVGAKCKQIVYSYTSVLGREFNLGDYDDVTTAKSVSILKLLIYFKQIV